INFGIDPLSRTSVVAGLNAKMSELHAATGLAMLDRFDDALDRRQATARRLQECLKAYPVTYQAGSDGSTWQGVQLLVPGASARTRALRLDEDLRMEVRTCFDPPLHRHRAFADAPAGGELVVTEEIAARSLSLPLANTFGPRQTARLVQLVDGIFEGRKC